MCVSVEGMCLSLGVVISSRKKQAIIINPGGGGRGFTTGGVCSSSPVFRAIFPNKMRTQMRTQWRDHRFFGH